MISCGASDYFFAYELCFKHNEEDGMKETYISKTITHGNVTITIRRPVLDDAEREKRRKQIVDGLGHSLRDYLRRAQ